MLTIILGALLGFLIYYKIVKPMSIWSDMGIAHEPSYPFVGSLGSSVMRTKHFFYLMKEIYKKFPNERYVGFFQFSSPMLLVRDLELIKQVCVKDFEKFHDHTSFFNVNEEELLSKSLINLNGDKWKKMRATLSPAFTSSKMKNMYRLIVECAQNFCGNFENKKVDVNLEMKDVFSKFAINVIASAAFGIQVDCIKEPNHEFYVNGQKLMNLSTTQIFKIWIFMVSPSLFKFFKLKMGNPEVEDFFRSTILNNVKERKEKGIVRHDLIHLLMEAQKGTLKHEETQEQKEGFATVEESHIGQSTNKMELTNDHLVAQASLFFFAGFETVSTVASFMAYELAINPDVQKKLQQEIDSVLEKSPDAPYETLMSMKYLDQVVSETLRKWPPAFVTDRQCNKDFEVVPKQTNQRKVVIKNGMMVGIPIVGLHYDPIYYPDPERFDPERFSEENKSNIVPGTYMPFGVGPRNCIGSRFALLEIKTLFFNLLAKFELVPNEKTEIPLVASPKKMTLSPENGFQMTLKPRE